MRFVYAITTLLVGVLTTTTTTTTAELIPQWIKGFDSVDGAWGTGMAMDDSGNIFVAASWVTGRYRR